MEKRVFKTSDRPKKTEKSNNSKKFDSYDKKITKKTNSNKGEENDNFSYKKDNFRDKKKFVSKDKSSLTKQKFNSADSTNSSEGGSKKFTTNKGSFSKKMEGYKGQSYTKKFNKYPLKKKVEKSVRVDDGTIRLNKYVANAGICSRRDADTFIKTGVVSVNDVVITEMGFRIKPGDVVKYNGETIKNQKKVYVLLNKPKDYVTTMSDPHAKRTVMELVTEATKDRIYPVGRLDRNTTGALLLTNDGDMTLKLTHPRNKITKIYHVLLDKPLTKNDMIKISEGIHLEDGIAMADKISYTDDKDKTMIGVEIHSGKNRIVRRMFESLDYKVERLDRVSFAGLSKKNIKRGEWRFLTEKEVGFLKMLGGKKLKDITDME